MNSTRTELIKSIHGVVNFYAGGIAGDRFTRTRAFLFTVLSGPVVSAREVSKGVREQTLDGISELNDADLVELHKYAISDYCKQR